MKKKDFKVYDRIYRLLKKPVCHIVSKKLNFTGEALPDGTGPLFILCNHNTDLDFLLLAGVSKDPLDFVATESMLRLGLLSRIAAKIMKPVLHDKGSSGVGTLKEIVSRIKAGRNILLFPEGNRSFDGRTGEISGAIGKIAKATGATLVVYRLEGGYFTSPRWGHGIRKGRMKGYVKSVISPDDVRKMSASELLSVVEEGLYTDAYEEQKADPVIFKSRIRAEYLESLMFICPSCGRIGALHSKKDRLSCECGYRLLLDEYGYATDGSASAHTITEMFSSQRELLAQKAREIKDTFLFNDRVTVCKLTDDHRIVAKAKSSICAFNDHLTIDDDHIGADSIVSVTVVQRNRLIIHIKDSDYRYEITGSKAFNAVKYQIFYETVFS